MSLSSFLASDCHGHPHPAVYLQPWGVFYSSLKALKQLDTLKVRIAIHQEYSQSDLFTVDLEYFIFFTSIFSVVALVAPKTWSTEESPSYTPVTAATSHRQLHTLGSDILSQPECHKLHAWTLRGPWLSLQQSWNETPEFLYNCLASVDQSPNTLFFYCSGISLCCALQLSPLIFSAGSGTISIFFLILITGGIEDDMCHCTMETDVFLI